MGLDLDFKRSMFGAACLLTGLFCLSPMTPCLADPPPIGYVGPAPGSTPLSRPTIAIPAPIAVSPVAVTPAAPTPVVQTPVAASTAVWVPPLGYTGPVIKNVPAPPNPQLPSYIDEKPNPHTGETLITAKQMHSDAATGIITATGKVEIVRGDYVLHADKVTYDQKSGVMTADGHVALLTPSGEVEFSTHEQITGDMKQAFAENIGILFPDNSRMAGVTGQRYDERYTVIDKGMYTACNICRDNPDNPPLWQLKTTSITHDNVDHELYYHNAIIDIAGVPVVYTPYIAAPDPTVERRQGFLSPLPGFSPNIGEYVKTPYYFDIAPDKDMTLTPISAPSTRHKSPPNIASVSPKANCNSKVRSPAPISSTTTASIRVNNGAAMYLAISFITSMISGAPAAMCNTHPIKAICSAIRYLRSTRRPTAPMSKDFRDRDYAVFNSYAFQDLRAGTDVSEPYVLPSATGQRSWRSRPDLWRPLVV